MLPDDMQLSLLRHMLEKYAPLSNSSWSLIVPYLHINAYPPSEHIVREGDINRELYFMTFGLVRHYYLNNRGKEYTKSFFRAGQLASNLSALVLGRPSQLYIQAIKYSECLSISYNYFLELAEYNAEWGNIKTQMLEQTLTNNEQYVAELLVLSAAERYEKLLNNCPDLVDTIPNYHIAAYLGITDVALSRIRRRMGLTNQSTPICR